jgi:hypothetical protein
LCHDVVWLWVGSRWHGLACGVCLLKLDRPPCVAGVHGHPPLAAGALAGLRRGMRAARECLACFEPVRHWIQLTWAVDMDP